MEARGEFGGETRPELRVDLDQRIDLAGCELPPLLAERDERIEGRAAELPAQILVGSEAADETFDIEQVLRECRGNKSKTARRLGLTRKLYMRLRQYALD